MSTERLPFGFNSLVPETYKTKAEAFAKCLHHKLLSLKGIATSSSSFDSESIKRLNNEMQTQDEGNLIKCQPECSGHAEKKNIKKERRRRRVSKGCTIPFIGSSHNNDKTEDSDDQSYSESEASDFSIRKRTQPKPVEGALEKLSSEDSTVESWGSCMENLTDLEKFDSETEDIKQMGGSGKDISKFRSLSHSNCSQNEFQDTPWNKNVRKSRSSSTESMESEEMKVLERQSDNFDTVSQTEYILFDGGEQDDSHLREVIKFPSKFSLENRLSSTEKDESSQAKPSTNSCKKITEECSELDKNLFPPKSLLDPVITDKKIKNEKKIESNQLTNELNKTQPKKVFENSLDFGISVNADDFKINEVSHFDKIATKEISKQIKKIGDVVEGNSEDSLKRNFVENLENVCNIQETVTSVEIIENKHLKGNYIEETNIQTDKNDGEPLNYDNSTKNEDIDFKAKLRRSSSLKTTKTPPGTPGAKKIVRFADALGLDLADVRTFLDDVPKIPSSAFEDLHFDLPICQEQAPILPLTLLPLFQQPGQRMEFLEKVQQQKICLETAVVTDKSVLAITGFVRVMNISYHKSVFVRYTLNNWKTFSDLQATYVPHSCDGFSDKFSFVLYGHTLKNGDKLEFALRLECCENQYWDSNGGFNYVFNCLPQTPESGYFPSVFENQLDSWHQFY